MSALLLALSLFVAQADEGAPTAAPPTPAAEKKTGNSEERFCRNEATLGSKIPKVRCYVKQEFERRQHEERQLLMKMQADAQAGRGG